MKKNIGKSIRDRLMNISKAQKTAFQIVSIRYFYERLLYRLSLSDYREKFYLKGGALLYATQKDIARPTLDIDFLGVNIKNDLAHIKNVFTELCLLECIDDGVFFDIESITTTQIMEGNNYKGIKVSLFASLDTIKQPMRIDIGFGDTIVPSEVELEYPMLLNTQQHISIIAYSLESVIAEKFHAMIEHGELNSRYKDFYDIFIILKNNNIDSLSLSDAIISTFKNRNTDYNNDHPLFTEEFFSDRIRQGHWAKFLKKINWAEILDFKEVVTTITTHLKPIYEKLK